MTIGGVPTWSIPWVKLWFSSCEVASHDDHSFVDHRGDGMRIRHGSRWIYICWGHGQVEQRASRHPPYWIFWIGFSYVEWGNHSQVPGSTHDGTPKATTCHWLLGRQRESNGDLRQMHQPPQPHLSGSSQAVGPRAERIASWGRPRQWRSNSRWGQAYSMYPKKQFTRKKDIYPCLGAGGSIEREIDSHNFSFWSL